jgi:hypothetical protein
MKIYFIFIFVALLGCSQKKQQSARSDITKIKLYFEDYLRIPYHWVWVTIEKKSDSILVHTVSKPLEDSIKWEYSKIDTNFILTSAAYNKLVDLVTRINNADLKSSSVTLDDGCEMTISFGDLKSEQTFNISTPSYDAVKRKTTHFYEASTEILKISGISFR